MVPSDYAIFTDHLTRSYDGRRVVDGLNLAIPRGSVYGLLGRNGAGKSTTIKMLTGMVQPDSGDAWLLGESVIGMTPQHREKVAYIAENHPLYGWMTVRESVAFARSFQTRWNQSLVEMILDHFEIPQRRKLSQLSNGQRAQVSLAIALAPEPELLILDDPTLGLDTVVRRDFLESMIEVIHESGRTIVLSSHILMDIDRNADRDGIMVKGRLVVDCPTDHFRSSVRRVVASFSGNAPDCSGLPGVINVRVTRGQLELIVVGFSEELEQTFFSLNLRNIDAQELNLEDAFIEFTRGSRRSLPPFSMEPVYA
jgi:ABC-2 type transport system ATP-binding protein